MTDSTSIYLNSGMSWQRASELLGLSDLIPNSTASTSRNNLALAGHMYTSGPSPSGPNDFLRLASTALVVGYFLLLLSIILVSALS